MIDYRILVITVFLMLVLPMTAAGAETINVTIKVNEYIVLNNDIHIGLLDVDKDMGQYAKVWFCSYQDSVGTTTTIYSCEGEIPVRYTSGTGMTIDVTLDSVFSDRALFVIASSTELHITERNFTEEEVPDADNDGVPDIWDLDNSTPAGYWTDSDGLGRMWGYERRW